MARWTRSDLVLFGAYIKAGWQVMRAAILMRATLKKNVVTIFGGAQVKGDDTYHSQAFEIAKQLAEQEYSILTGGGPGVMEAANCGADAGEHKTKSTTNLGIGVAGIDEDFENKCGSFIRVNQFFGRKWLLIRYSVAAIVFPGGIGTVDELFELLNALKHHQIKHIPVILVGVDFWQPLIDWYNHSLQMGYIATHNARLFQVVDDTAEILKIITHATAKH